MKSLIPLILALFANSIQATETPRLGTRLEMSDLQSLSIHEIRKHGLRIFSTPFNTLDGLGDGPLDLSEDPTQFGGRPTLHNNGFALRFNGLDSQTCLECHSILSNKSIPATFSPGGVGGIAASAFPGILNPDIDDDGDNNSTPDDGNAESNGRMINPPFNFGAGAIEALAKEMTSDLQNIKLQAHNNPGNIFPLISKGINFGTISHNDNSNIQGIDNDLVVRPFGRKGCCFSIRDFDRGAMMFHHGMQPEEVVGLNIDADNDGVTNEITIGEMSALHIYQATLPTPTSKHKRRHSKGKQLFTQIGCASCHTPKLHLNSTTLDMAFPEIPTDPTANIYTSVQIPIHNRHNNVQLFSDLKRHNMGPGLAESTGSIHDPIFVTARLWGIADTAPYLHDGRALTLHSAITMHGGEAQFTADNYNNLSSQKQNHIIKFLNTLRTPRNPNHGLIQ